MLTIPCVIFAGGKSSRMGEDKALLPFAGHSTLAEYQYTRLSKIFQTVYISCKDASVFPFEANFIEDDKKSDVYAPTAGFVAIYKAIPDERFFAISVDSPFIDENIITKLLHCDRDNVDATIAKTPEGIQPLCGIYHRSLEKTFQTMLDEENHKLGLLLKNAKTAYCLFEERKSFLNMNHPEDYKKALSLIHC
ncbi:MULTISPECIES: molybdenum cofactor guanylyltransferase MobA [Sulfurimonas]|uniref:molybdenum cofactor guanylyltransferase MobA n=1 Tax=Sulfurimonas TaxID=202746 RepID=UPI001264C76E|nr:molybdenum cofactor guanylyltransferase MobA [Sulfurimonas indica]